MPDTSTPAVPVAPPAPVPMEPQRPSRRSSKSPITLQGLGKLIAAGVPCLAVILGAVIYLEHRFAGIERELAELRGHVNSVGADQQEGHEAVVAALQALEDNQNIIATELIYCCELSKETARQIKTKSKPKILKGIRKGEPLTDPLAGLDEHYKVTPTKTVKDIVRKDLVFEGNPGVTIHENY